MIPALVTAISTDIGDWIATYIIVAYISSLYKMNKFFSIAQYTIFAAVAANSSIVTLEAINKTAIQPMVGGQILLIIPVIIGLLYFTIYINRFSFMTRYTTGLLTGIGFGLMAGANFATRILAPTADTINQLTASSDPLSVFNALFVFVASILVLFYFVYTIKVGRTTNRVMQIGRYALLAALGAFASDTAAGNISYILVPLVRVIWRALGLPLA